MAKTPKKTKTSPERKRDRHHYHCQSRCLFESSKTDRRNIWDGIYRNIHDDWHWMFNNMIPIEVIHCLVTRWCTEDVTFKKVHIVSKFEGRHYEFKMGEEPKVYDTYAGKPRRCQLRYQRVFGRHTSLFHAVVRVIERWSPKISTYWHKVSIVAEVAGVLWEYHIVPPRKRRRKRRR